MTAIDAAFKVGRVDIKPVYGDITTLPADALVQPSGTSQRDWPAQAAPWVIEADTDARSGKRSATTCHYSWEASWSRPQARS